MKSIQRVRLWLIIVGAIFLALDVASAALLLSPAGRSRAEKERTFSSLRNEALSKRREVLPARDIDTKLKLASEQVKTFYGQRLPRLYSEVSEVLGKEAAANHVQLASVKYDLSARNVLSKEQPQRQLGSDLQPLALTVDVDGTYTDQVRFLNSLERSKVFFIPTQVNFGGQQQNNNLRVTLRLETFLRTGA